MKRVIKHTFIKEGSPQGKQGGANNIYLRLSEIRKITNI